MVERVKHLESELQPLALGEIPILLYGHVPIEEFGSMKIREESGSISECECGRLRKRVRINPVVDRLVRRYRVHAWDDVGPLVETETDIVRGWLDGKRETRFRGEDSAPRPTAQNRV